jgi:hypothetical protein
MEKLKSLLVNNQSVFSMFKFDLGLTNLVQHKIDAKDEKPVKIPPRRVPLAQRKEVATEIQKMVENWFGIASSHSLSSLGRFSIGMISWSMTVCPIAAQVFLYMVRGLSDTLIRFNGITSFVSEHRDLATKIP